MKNKLTKTAIAAAFILSYAGMASSHDLNNQTIGKSFAATDYYQVTCSDDGTGAAARLNVQVNDDTPGTSVLSLVVKKGLLVRTTTDPKGADGKFSTLVSLVPPAGQGNGIYDVLVHKNQTTSVARQYDIRYHCITAGNLHTGTSIAVKQNH